MPTRYTCVRLSEDPWYVDMTLFLIHPNVLCDYYQNVIISCPEKWGHMAEGYIRTSIRGAHWACTFAIENKKYTTWG